MRSRSGSSWRGRPARHLPRVRSPSRPGSALPPHLLATLCNLLATTTSTPDRCRFATWEGYGWQAWADPPPTSRLRLDQRTFLVHEGPIETAGQIGWRSSEGIFTAHPPTLIWPADRAWFVAGDVDLDSTYVGGSEDLIAALLAEPDLEARVVVIAGPAYGPRLLV